MANNSIALAVGDPIKTITIITKTKIAAQQHLNSGTQFSKKKEAISLFYIIDYNSLHAHVYNLIRNFVTVATMYNSTSIRAAPNS